MATTNFFPAAPQLKTQDVLNTQAKGWLWLNLLLLTACSTTDFSDTATPTPFSTAADRSGAVNLPDA